jgi:hypothetical protein
MHVAIGNKVAKGKARRLEIGCCTLFLFLGRWRESGTSYFCDSPNLRHNKNKILAWVTLDWGFELDIQFIDYLQTLVVTTLLNHGAIADFHVLQITRAHAKSFQSAFTSRFPVTDLNNGDYSSALTQVFSSQTTLQLTKSKSKSCYERRSVGQSVMVSSTHLELTRFSLLSDSSGSF